METQSSKGDHHLLELRGLQASYSKKIKALKNVDLYINRGEIVALIGPNGAGKTTLLRAISAVEVNRDQGDILWRGNSILALAPHQVARLGIAHVPEGRKIFARLTVFENIQMGAFARTNQAEIQEDFEYVFSLFPILKERWHQLGGTLSGGEQQMLAIARALMMRPELLMLDEPSMGLAPVITDKIFDVISAINKQGKTIFLIEQNAIRALEVAHRAYVLETGCIVMDSPAAKLLNDPRVQESYLGVG